MSALSQRAVRVPNQAAETLSGTVTGVRFYNPRNAWSVLSVRAGEESVAAVGPCVNPREGDEYQFQGSYIVDPKYGRQFKFDSAEILLPSTRKGIIRYLASIAAGVGEVKAARIVGALGDDCLIKLQSAPDALDTLNFLSAQQREEIKTHLREHSAVAEVSGLICKEGVTPALAAKIVAVFGEDAAQICKEEPYRLIEIDGIGFLTADKVAMAVKIPEDAPARIQAAVRHILSEAENEGHCSLRPSDLVHDIPVLLGTNVETSRIAEAVGVLIHAEMLVRDGDDIYLAELYEDEVDVAERVKVLAAKRPEPITNLDGQVAACETNAGITYHPKQREAIAMALTSGFSVLTGGPGTGKTQITKAIVSIYKAECHTKPVYLCSPTGRAAKRLAEATGVEAKTIHRLLGYVPELGFMVNENEPLAPGLLIADEASMIDISLARALLSACSSGMQVVLIGDADQLPSVGPGSVLRDIINSDAVPVTRLAYVYRQEDGSGISALANKINAGEMPDLTYGMPYPDTFYDCISSPDEALPLAVKYAKEVYNRYGLLQFSVLAPGHRGSAGIKALNDAIREAINPGAKGSKGFVPGDRVMVVKNSYQHEVFNGDLGLVRSTDDEDGSIEVDFDNRTVTFGYEDGQAPMDILHLAFASTVHKSQGGEYAAVIMVLTRQHYIMLARTLIYTGITRAKKTLFLICQDGCLKQAVRNNKVAARNSRLVERLRGGEASA